MTPAQFLVRCSREGIRIAADDFGVLFAHGADSDRIEDYLRRHDAELRRLLGLTPRIERQSPTREADSLLSPDEFEELAALAIEGEAHSALFEEATWNGLPRIPRLTLPSGVYVDDPNP